MKDRALQQKRHRDDFRDMLHWDDADLMRHDELRRELEAKGLSRAEAARRAAITVRRERRGRAA